MTIKFMDKSEMGKGGITEGQRCRMSNFLLNFFKAFLGCMEEKKQLSCIFVVSNILSLL